mgnify:CR=1 FL=1
MYVLKSFKYRIYPTKAQTTKMERTLDLCRWVYNETLAYRKTLFETEGKSSSKYATNALLPTWKVDKPDLKEVFSQTLQNVQERVDLAFKAFFRRIKAGEKPGYPRFKGKGWYDSFTYPQMGFKLDNGLLKLSKIGNIKIKLHGPIEGKIKRLTVRRTATGKWFACFSVEIEDQPKGTPDRKKALKVVERVHERIANKRYEFAHQISNDLVKRFGLIAFEDLNIKGMVKNHCLAKSIHDVAWNMLVQPGLNKPNFR